MNKAAQTPALDTQVGGEHYKNMKIQPVEFSLVNNLNAAQHSILKYLVRNKADDDLDKAQHFAALWDDVDRLYTNIEFACLDRRRFLGLAVLSVDNFVAANGLEQEIGDIMVLFLVSPSRQRVAMARDKIRALDKK